VCVCVSVGVFVYVVILKGEQAYEQRARARKGGLIQTSKVLSFYSKSDQATRKRCRIKKANR
jgi:hypothetical protein